MKQLIHLLAAAAVLVLPACSKHESEAAATSSEAVKANKSLGDTLTGDSRFKTLTADLKATGLDGVFSGKGQYTLLAPTDDAFKALGDKAAGLSGPDHQALLAAVLRSHVVPGMLTTADIGKAIDANKGEPISMRTMGSGSVKFARSGSGLTVTGSDGSTARLAGDGVSASNGAVLPIDAVLKKL